MLGQRPSPMLKACWRTCPVAFHSTACRQGKVNAKCSSHVSRSFGSTRRARRSQLAERSCTHLKALPDSSDQTGRASMTSFCLALAVLPDRRLQISHTPNLLQGCYSCEGKSQERSASAFQVCWDMSFCL